MDDITLDRPARHRISVDAFVRMIEAGVFAPEDRIELIDGELIDMAPIGKDHAGASVYLLAALVHACGGRALVSSQNPVTLDLTNRPQPDFAVLRNRPDYRSSPATPADVLLLIELSHSSLQHDRSVKLPLYAQAGIPEYWIVDLKRSLVEGYRNPSGDAYANTSTHSAGNRIALAADPTIVVTLDLG